MVTDVERFFDKDRVIVSKTDTRGIITYANDVFIQISGYTEEELIGKPHNILRHPAMPACVFKLLWDTVKSGQEIFAYVINQCKNGDHYWAYAHVTPTFGRGGEIIGFHSNRRVPSRSAISTVEPIYQTLLAEENKYSTRREGMEKATDLLMSVLKQKGVSYDQFAISLAA